MTFTRFLVGVAMGIALGVMLLLIGGITWQPPTPSCPGCAVLNANVPHPATCYAEVVQGGYICG